MRIQSSMFAQSPPSKAILRTENLFGLEKGESALPVVDQRDIVNLSPEGLLRSRKGTDPVQKDKDAKTPEPTPSKEADGQTLTDTEKQEVEKLKQRDAQVHNHEQAHLAAAGPHARGGAHFTYANGPDGRRYAVGGEVSIDVGEESEPEATIKKMQVVRKAALAPVDPSAADRRIASKASQLESKARVEIRAAELDESEPTDEASSPRPSSGSDAEDVPAPSPKPQDLIRSISLFA